MKFLQQFCFPLLLGALTLTLSACGGGGGGGDSGSSSSEEFSAPKQLGIPSDTRIQATIGNITHIWRCRSDMTAKWTEWEGTASSVTEGNYSYIAESGSKKAQLSLNFMDGDTKFIVSLNFTGKDTATASVMKTVYYIHAPYFENFHYEDVPVQLFWD